MLAWLFKKIIEAYWEYVPESKRRICIYKTTCSRAVYHKIIDEGFYAGIKLFFYRKSNCKEGFSFFLDEDEICIKTRKGEVVNEMDINTLLLREYKIKIQ